MSLQSKTKQILDQAMGGKKQADALVAKLEANSALSSQELRELETAMADKKAAANINSAAQANIAADNAAVSAAQSAFSSAVSDRAASKAALDIAQAAYDATPNPTTLAALNAAQADYATKQAAVVSAEATLNSARSQASNDSLSNRSKNAIEIAMITQAAASDLEQEIES